VSATDAAVDLLILVIIALLPALFYLAYVRRTERYAR